jgi:prevent-host-death family protein
MQTVTSSDVAKNFAAFIDRAKREPILVTAYGRPQIVMMSVEEYERLRRLDQRAIATAELPQDMCRAIAAAEAPSEAARFNHEVEGHCVFRNCYFHFAFSRERSHIVSVCSVSLGSPTCFQGSVTFMSDCRT